MIKFGDLFTIFLKVATAFLTTTEGEYLTGVIRNNNLDDAKKSNNEFYASTINSNFDVIENHKKMLIEEIFEDTEVRLIIHSSNLTQKDIEIEFIEQSIIIRSKVNNQSYIVKCPFEINSQNLSTTFNNGIIEILIEKDRGRKDE